MPPGNAEPAKHNAEPSIKAKPFQHDPQAMLATTLMQEHVLTDKKDFEKKYKDKMLMVEGRVAFVGPFFQTGRVYLYGFTQEKCDWSDFLPEDPLMTQGVVSIGARDYGSVPTLEKLKHRQWVRVRGKCDNILVQVHLSDIEILAIGEAPQGEHPHPGMLRTEKEWKRDNEQNEKTCKALEALKVTAFSGGNHPARFTAPAAKLEEQHFTPDGGILPPIVDLLARLPNLQLTLTSSKVGDAALKQINGLTQMLSLSIELPYDETPPITDNGLKELAKLTNLRQLKIKPQFLSSSKQMEGIGASSFGSLTKLEILDLTSLKLSDTDLVFLPKLKRLRVLKLHGSGITDKGLVGLKEFAELRELSLDHTGVTSAGLKGIENCLELQSVALGKTGVDDRALSLLCRLPLLRDLDLDETKVTDAGVKSFKGMRFLDTISLKKTAVTSTAMETLAELPRLKWLNISNTNVANDGLLKFANQPSELIIRCGGSKVTTEGRKQLMRKRIKAEVNLDG